jgi:ubiquinone/menaquinone biosynthesis C-methylase UbiE
MPAHAYHDAPNADAAVASYAQLVADYDRACQPINSLRRDAVALLNPQPGQRVLDVACGTGYCLPLLAQAVGLHGQVLGIEQSPQMLRLAQERTQALPQVSLRAQRAEELEVAERFDAALFSFTHDVLRSITALQAVMACVKPGGLVVACGAQHFPHWLAWLNWWVRYRERGFITTVEGLDRPWSHLPRWAPDFHVVKTAWGGCCYLGVGRVTQERAA